MYKNMMSNQLLNISLNIEFCEINIKNEMKILLKHKSSLKMIITNNHGNFSTVVVNQPIHRQK